MTDNLRAVVWNADDQPDAVVIQFQAREIEEPVSFKVITSVPIVDSMWQMPGLIGEHWLSLLESKGQTHYAISIDKIFLDHHFIIGLRLKSEGNPKIQILSIEIWDKLGGDGGLVYMEFGT
jgi:hypothetical protein